MQQRSGLSDAGWWQTNIVGQYSLSKKISIAGRIEYFSDPEEVQIVPITGVTGFSSYSSSVGLNLRVTENILFRGEARTFFSEKEIYERNGVDVKNSNLLTINLTAWF